MVRGPTPTHLLQATIEDTIEKVMAASLASLKYMEIKTNFQLVYSCVPKGVDHANKETQHIFKQVETKHNLIIFSFR